MVSYPAVFARYAITRDFPWVTLFLIALGVLLTASGVALAFRCPDAYRGKISGSIVGVLTVLLVGFFLFEIFFATKRIPASRGAPQLGETAPDFTLPDSEGNNVTLSALLDSSFSTDDRPTYRAGSGKTAAVTLIFYRGYW
jgi:hypothetical protein